MGQTPRVIERQIFIAAAPETVFRFLVEPSLMARWIGISHELDPRPGGIFRVEVSHGNVALGAYLEVTPPLRVVFSWGWEAHAADRGTLANLPPGASLVEIELESKDGGTLLRLRHSDLPGELDNIHRERWSVYLARLEAIFAAKPEARQ